MQRKHTTEQLDQHQRAVDRIIFLAVKRRECERPLREHFEAWAKEHREPRDG